MTDDIVERVFQDLPQRQAKTKADRENVERLERELPQLKLGQRGVPEDIEKLIASILAATRESLALAEQALGLLRNRQDEIDRLREEVAQLKGQRPALRAVPGARELPDDDPPEPPGAA
jgi:polyhydroxyalkanoate synthesis regulator phasin